MIKLLFLNVLFFISFSCTAQYDSIHSSLLKVNEKIYLGKSESFLLNSLGTPSSKKDFFFEMDNTKGVIYTYNGIIFNIINEKINSFEITNDSFTVINPEIKIGSSLETLKKYFPNSYKVSTHKDGLTVTFSDIDKFIVFEWGYSKINKISVYDY